MSESNGNLYDLLIIGAGASGMSAALSYQKERILAGKGFGKVLILEKNERVGKKEVRFFVVSIV